MLIWIALYTLVLVLAVDMAIYARAVAARLQMPRALAQLRAEDAMRRPALAVVRPGRR